jgi:sugar phosphate isomerase/epimerase
VSAIVTHPDVVHDPSAYRRLGRRLVFENLDARAPDGQLTALERLFESLPAAGFCLDVAPAWSVDPTMQLANELLDSYRNRLRHLHVSSLDPAHRHAPLTVEHAAAYEPVLARCRDVPWVLEAPLPAP